MDIRVRKVSNGAYEGETIPMFGGNKSGGVQDNLIKSVSYSQDEIIQWIMDLNGLDCFDVDPTYSKGNFYKNIKQPTHKFDILPLASDVISSDCRHLPLDNCSVTSVMFDPPFVGGSRKDGKAGIIKSRFGYYKNIPTLWDMYKDALKEFYRILKPNGIVVFKCQDSVESGKQYFTEFKVIKTALDIGFYPKDKFILLAKNRIISPNQVNQSHARKYHSYMLVFVKTTSRVNYGM